MIYMNTRDRDSFFGELTSGRWNFRDGAGQQIVHPEEIFPIFRQDSSGFVEVLGTGFFIIARVETMSSWSDTGLPFSSSAIAARSVNGEIGS